jgi:hypothetical protein
MQVATKLIVYSIFLVLSSCISTEKVAETELSTDRFDLIFLGHSKEIVSKILGQPSEVRRIKSDVGDSELWIYNDHSVETHQRGAVRFSGTLSSVTGVTVIPSADSKELQLDYLLNVKFVGVVFEKVPIQRCGQDFSSEKIYYINAEKGIVLEQESQTAQVLSFFWANPDYIKEMRQKIKFCKR